MPTTVTGALHATDQATVIGSVGMFVQAPTAGLVPMVHEISAGQAVSPGVVFVGRREETERLLAVLAPGDSDSSPVVVSAVAGMGGVGKTALARFCAAEAVERGWFPGGAYVVDLQGYSPGGMVSGNSVFAPLLHHFGTAAENVPGDPAAQAVLYDQVLRVMAEQGQRVLLVLDNASTATQVNGLLPATRGHRVVVTTRDTLAIPGARRLDLDVLSEDDALAMLDQALREHDVMMTDGATTLVGVCGLLPLAVRIVAGLLADEPDISCAELAAELANTATDAFAHGETRVAPVLATSIDHLARRDPQAVRLLRLLALSPGPDISTKAAAALGDLSVADARVSLRALRHAHLINLVDRRWRLHDLIRRYLLDRLEDRAAATTRLLNYYTITAVAADEHFLVLPGVPAPNALFTGREQALAWFDAEHAVLVAAVQWAATVDRTAHTIYLAGALSEYQSWRRHLNDRLATSRTALAACRKHGDRSCEARAWNNLGDALRQLRRFTEAISAYEHSRDICREIGDRDDEGVTWNNLGTALGELQRFDEAIDAHKHDLAICQEIGNRRGEGTAWISLSSALAEKERFDEAIVALERGRDICQEIGDRHNEGRAWNNLGLVFHSLGRFHEAVVAHKHNLTICRETGNRHREGLALNNLGYTLREMEMLEEAVPVLELARDICRETLDRHQEGQTWVNLGLTVFGLGRFDEARSCLREGVAAFTESGDIEGAQNIQQALENLDAHQDATGS